MSLLLFYDCETQGLPLFDQPSEDPRQPHIVQLAAALVDEDTRACVSSINLIAKPDGWTIPDDVVAIHGITTERAAQVGIPEHKILEVFILLSAMASKRVAHNESFDARMVRIAIKRFWPDGEADEFADKWKAWPSGCTCWESMPICQLPGKGKAFKKPKLSEAYQHFFGKPMTNAHTAQGDVQACMDVYWAIQDHNAAKAA